MKLKRPNFSDDVTETRQTPGHFEFSVEVINPQSGWAEFMEEEFDIVSALHLIDQLRGEGARLYCKRAGAKERQ